jgi:hypothetical protein
MRRRWCCIPAVCLFLATPLVRAQPDTKPFPFEPYAETPAARDEDNGLHLRIEAGYVYKRLHGIPFQMADVGLAFGVFTVDLHSHIYFGVHQSLGRSEYGLRAQETSVQGLIAFRPGRLHLGIEPRLARLSVQRETSSGSIVEWSLGASGVLGLDLVRTDSGILQAFARGGADIHTDEEHHDVAAFRFVASLAYDF